MKIIYVAKSVFTPWPAQKAFAFVAARLRRRVSLLSFLYLLFKVQLWLTSFEDYCRVLLANLPSNTARIYVLHKVLSEYLGRYIFVNAVIHIAAIAIITPSVGAVAIHNALRYRRSVDALMHLLLVFT